MKRSFVIILLVLAVVVILLFLGKGKKLEAPTINENTQIKEESTIPLSQTTPEPVSNTTESTVKEFTISGKNFSFNPNVINVNKGDKVKIIFNNTEGFHDFKIDEFGLATKQAKSPDTEVLEFTADKVGSFVYYCSVGSHKSMGMWGTLNIK